MGSNFCFFTCPLTCPRPLSPSYFCLVTSHLSPVTFCLWLVTFRLAFSAPFRDNCPQSNILAEAATKWLAVLVRRTDLVRSKRAGWLSECERQENKRTVSVEHRVRPQFPASFPNRRLCATARREWSRAPPESRVSCREHTCLGVFTQQEDISQRQRDATTRMQRPRPRPSGGSKRDSARNV
jgi:hypothetical protein